MTDQIAPVLILGAGINGAALARELALNGVPVVIVDSADVCFGATAYSSRLIHGGLRYLEYGDFALVRESLAERTRLLRLAPQFVRPLHIHIPVTRRSGGWLGGAIRFLGGKGSDKPSQRGLWLIRTGLWLYDRFARDPSLPHRTVRRVGHDAGPKVDPQRYRWLCGYWDAQIRFPERYVQALLADARHLAHEAGVAFRVLTYHHARQRERIVELLPIAECLSPETIEVSAIVNATGAWVDLTLSELDVPSPKLMAGTKGTHFITFHEGLRRALADQALYAEAEDGRPVFILPFGESVLVGTTDIPFSGRPEEALASDEELGYLVAAVNDIFPQVRLTQSDLELHYCGVRPLPASHAATPASVTRRHKLVVHEGVDVPTFSIVGGKLTTSRQLAEEATATILTVLGKAVSRNSRTRAVPGGEDYPATNEALAAVQREIAREFSLAQVQVAAGWALFGTRLRSVLIEADRPNPSADVGWENLDGTSLPLAIARWIITHEVPHKLDDLVERRLMLLYHRPLTPECVRQLASLLVEAKVISPADVGGQVAAAVARLNSHFGKNVAGIASREVD